jgi:hypothetical protein
MVADKAQHQLKETKAVNCQREGGFGVKLLLVFAD